MKKIALVLLSISLFSIVRSAEESSAVSATKQLAEIVFRPKVDSGVLEKFLASTEGYDINAKPTLMFEDFTPLRFHAYFGNRQACEVLLRYGADRYDGDPFITALEQGHLCVAQLFRETESDVIERYHDTALDAAVSGRSSDCISWLLSCGIPVPLFSHALLLDALENGLHEFAQVLLARTALEASPEVLRAAAIGGNGEICRLMLERGVSVDAQDERGVTPLFYARSAGHEEVALLLEQWGGHATQTSKNALSVTTVSLSKSGDVSIQTAETLLVKLGFYCLKAYAWYRRCTDPCRGKVSYEQKKR